MAKIFFESKGLVAILHCTSLTQKVPILLHTKAKQQFDLTLDVNKIYSFISTLIFVGPSMCCLKSIFLNLRSISLNLVKLFFTLQILYLIHLLHWLYCMACLDQKCWSIVLGHIQHWNYAFSLLKKSWELNLELSTSFTRALPLCYHGLMDKKGQIDIYV